MPDANNKHPISKKLFSQMQEKSGVHYRFDTTLAGPFLLPLLDEFEDADKGEDCLVLKFRDKAQKKQYEVPLSKDALDNLFSFLSIALKNFDSFGQKQKKKPQT